MDFCCVQCRIHNNSSITRPTWIDENTFFIRLLASTIHVNCKIQKHSSITLAVSESVNLTTQPIVVRRQVLLSGDAQKIIMRYSDASLHYIWQESMIAPSAFLVEIASYAVLVVKIHAILIDVANVKIIVSRISTRLLPTYQFQKTRFQPINGHKNFHFCSFPSSSNNDIQLQSWGIISMFNMLMMPQDWQTPDQPVDLKEPMISFLLQWHERTRSNSDASHSYLT